MVHGNPTWSFFFRDLVCGLRDVCRVVVPDHIGCGRSEKPPESRYAYTLDSRVDDLEALLDHLELRRNVTLVLHDWGGLIGMAAACRRPERIARLVILNTAAFRLPAGKRLPWSLRLCRAPGLGPLLVRGMNAFCLGAARACVVRPLAPEVRAGYLEPYDSWENRVAVLRFVQDIPLGPRDGAYSTLRSVEDGLERFRSVPMLVLWGERDFVFDADFRAEWERRFPEAEVHRFPGAGHYVLEDAGAEILALVRRFVTGPEGSGA
jgi:pimeloyl-ACP methyl ester carboxylesterase